MGRIGLSSLKTGVRYPSLAGGELIQWGCPYCCGTWFESSFDNELPIFCPKCGERVVDNEGEPTLKPYEAIATGFRGESYTLKFTAQDDAEANAIARDILFAMNGRVDKDNGLEVNIVEK